MSLGYAYGAAAHVAGSHFHPLPDLDVNCTHHHGVPWVWNVFHECVTNNVQYAGFFLGLLSILCWLVVFLPQFYEAFKNGKMDEALSPLFLFCWFLGDVSNLVGSILSNQLGTQIVVAYYYIGMDCLVLLQFSYYYMKNRRRRHRSGELRVSYDSMAKTHRNQVIYCTGGLLVLASTTWFSLSPWRQAAVHPGGRATGRTLLGLEESADTICKVLFLDTEDCMFYTDKEIIGYACGCVSAFFYLASRVPQLYKNFKRKSVEGVAILMFILTVLGNVFYGLSILMEDDSSVVFFIRHFPWLLGSLGTLCFDCTVLVQFRLYRKRPPGYAGIDGDESRGLLGPNTQSDDETFYRPADGIN